MAELVPDPGLNGSTRQAFADPQCGLGFGGSGQELPNDVKHCNDFQIEDADMLDHYPLFHYFVRQMRSSVKILPPLRKFVGS